MSKWYVDKGEQGDIVLSTRVRLARNLEEFPFPCRLDTASRIKVNEKVRDTLLSCVPELGLHYVTMDSLSREQAISLAERHLISPEFASVREGRALMLTEDETVGIMLCEEDHIRVQVMKAGLALMDCYVLADKIDSALDKKLNFAFDESLGYLTQCPTNLGTAMRASVMLHLPALRRSGQLAVLSSTISKLGLTLRGAYGEGRESRGDIYQLSNQITLGITEQAAIENLQSITRQLVTQGHFTVGGRKVNIPSYQVKPGMVISLTEKGKSMQKIKENIEDNAFRAAPKWIEYDKNNLTAKIVAVPAREDIDMPIEERLIVELYSK